MKSIILLFLCFLCRFISSQMTQSDLGSATQLTIIYDDAGKRIRCGFNQSAADTQLIHMRLQVSDACEESESYTFLADINMWTEETNVGSILTAADVSGQIDSENHTLSYLLVTLENDFGSHEKRTFQCAVHGVTIKGQPVTATKTVGDGTCIPNQVNELNQRTKFLDTAIKLVDGKVRVLGTAVNASGDNFGILNATLNGLEDKVEEIENDVKEGGENIGTLKDTVNKNGGNIGRLNNSLAEHDSYIKALDTDVNENVDSIGLLNATVNKNRDKVWMLNFTLNDYGGIVAALYTAVEEHGYNIKALNTTIKVTSNTLMEVGTKVKSGSDNIEILNTELKTLEDKFYVIRAETNENGDSIRILNDTVDENTDNFRILSMTVNEYGNIIGIFNTTVVENGKNIDKANSANKRLEGLVDAEVKRLDDKVEVLDTTMKGLEGKLDALDTAVKGLQGTVGALDTSVNTLTGQIQGINSKLSVSLDADKELKKLSISVLELNVQVRGFYSPSRSHVYNNKLYIFSKNYDRFNIDNANNVCKGLGGYLIELNNVAEYNFVNNIVKSKGTEYFTGYTDRTRERTFTHIETGSLLTINAWKKGEPNNKGNEDCIDFYKGGVGLNDGDCDDNIRYICEIPSPY